MSHGSSLTLYFTVDETCILNHISFNPTEFTLGSFCTVMDVSNFSKLQTLRLDGNEISRQDIPSESSLCLRQASSIEV